MIRNKTAWSFLLAILSCLQVLAQNIVSPPGSTVITASPLPSDSIGSIIGQTFYHSNTSWPPFENNCYVFAINDTLYNAINGYNPTPAGGFCNPSNMANLVFNPGSSNLAAGLIVYTGTTSYRYLNTSSVFVTNNSIPVRATITFSSPVTYYPNNTFVLPVTSNFNFHVVYESFSPPDALYSSVSANTWVPSKKLFDDMTTDSNNSICLYFQNGNYTLHQVVASTSPSASLCQGGVLQLIGGGTGNNLSFNWTGPNSFVSPNPNASITNPSPSNSGTYTLKVTDDVGCHNSSNTIITIHQEPVAIAGGTATICVNSTATVSGAIAQFGTISWTHNGSGSLSNMTTLTPTYNPAPSDAGNTIVLTMTVTSNNACAPSTAQATFNIIVQGNPKAIDGVTTTLCTSSSYTVNTATAQFGTIHWTHNGSGTLTNVNTATPTYTPSPLDDGNMVVLTLTVTSNNLCAPGTATAFHILNIVPLPHAVAGGSVMLCENSSYTVTSAVASYGTINWTHNGTGTLTGINTVNPTYEAAPGDVGNIITLTMTVTSTGCINAIASADFSITVQGLPSATITNSSTICAGTSALISGASVSNGTFSWSHNGAGVLLNNGTINPTYNSSISDGGNTVQLLLNVTSNNSCSPATYTGIYNVTVDNVPVATLPSNMNICGGIPHTVSNAVYNYGTPSWTTTGAGTLADATTGSPTYTPSPSDYGNIVILTLNVSSNNTCAPNILSSSFNVFVQHPPVAIAGGTTTTCESSVANITGSTATYGTIHWTHDGGGTLNGATTLGPTYIPAASDVGNPVTLTLHVTSNNSCAPMVATDTYSVIIDPLPIVNAGITEHICVNTPYTIPNASSNYGSIFWEHNGLGTLSDPTTITPTYTPSSSEEGDTVILTITVKSNNTCAPENVSDIYSLIIDPNPTLILSITSDTMCAGSVYHVTNAAATNGSIMWTHNGTGTLTDETTMTPSYIAGPSDAGNLISLTCVVTSTNGCAPQSLTESILIFVESTANSPSISIDNIQNVSCYGDATGAISLQVTGGASPYSFEWNNNQNTQNISGLQAGIYTVNLTDDHGCTITDTFLITQPDDITLDIVMTPIDCANLTDGSLVVTASGGVSPYDYTWPSINTKNDTITGINAGDYDVIVTDLNGCTHTETITLETIGLLNVQANPNAINVNYGTENQLSVTGADSYSWSPGQYLSCSDCETPICTPTSSTNYIVTGSNPNGCIGRDTVIVSVYVDCDNLTLPTIFSPNETGPESNNTFGLIGATPCVETYILLIFNRWGEQVFESQNVRDKWDGTYKGTPQSTGVYFYRLDMNLVNGEVIQKSGNITLVR